MLENVRLRDFTLVTLIAALCILVQLFAPESIENLRYQSREVLAGEWWRIISANFCHSNWNHLLLNLSGLFIIDFLFQLLIPQKTRALLLAFCIILNVYLLHVFMNLHWYVGLSGALHGYLYGNALLSWNKSRGLSQTIIAVVSLKLAIELTWEINEVTADMIAANVVEEAHLFGAISSVIFVLITVIINQLTLKKGA